MYHSTLKALFKPHMCSLKCTSCPSALENRTAHLDQVLPALGLWEKGQEYQFKARSQSVSPSVTVRTVVALQELPYPATLNSQKQICIPPVNRKAIVCTIESHDLMTIHEKLLNSLVWGILHRALHGANRI